jgi:hypothetical protein
MSKLDSLPYVVSPDRTFWRAVALLAGARNAGNASVRFSAHRSRGADGDVRTELMGTFGELAVWLWAEGAGVECAPPTILSMTGPPRDIDFHIVVDNLRIGLEAKAWTPTKLDGTPAKRININVEGHKRSRKRGGEQYIFIFGELGGGRSVVTAAVPHDEVDNWVFDAGPYGDPMVFQSIELLAPRVLAGRSSDALRVYLSEVEPSATYEELKEWRASAVTHIDGIVDAIQQETSPSALLARLDSLR